jgi:hypothetical protein
VNSETPSLVPRGSVDPDRSLVQSVDPSGKRASDGEIETGKFVIAPPPQFSLILDMEPADIAFVEV